MGSFSEKGVQIRFMVSHMIGLGRTKNLVNSSLLTCKSNSSDHFHILTYAAMADKENLENLTELHDNPGPKYQTAKKKKGARVMHENVPSRVDVFLASFLRKRTNNKSRIELRS